MVVVETSPCRECDLDITALEYHPYAYCVLYKANIDVGQFVAEALRLDERVRPGGEIDG